jgi:hypothetical protein
VAIVAMLLLIAPEHEAVSDIDQIVIRLCIEYQEAVDIQEAIRCRKWQDKENVTNASQVLVPKPQPLPSTADFSCNPLSSLLTNRAPSLVSKLSPKLTGMRKQILTSYDTNKVMV